MRALALAFLLVPLAACGGGDDASADGTDVAVDPSGSSTAGAVDTAPAAPAGAVAEVVNGAVTLQPQGEEMRYAQTEFTVAAGQSIRLVFQNTATGAAMQHNVVILQPGTDADAFGQAAMSAADTGYIPEAMKAQVVASTPMSAPGETVEVAFTAPTAPGDYVYLCTFPGHYMTMRGTMRVVAA